LKIVRGPFDAKVSTVFSEERKNRRLERRLKI